MLYIYLTLGIKVHAPSIRKSQSCKNQQLWLEKFDIILYHIGKKIEKTIMIKSDATSEPYAGMLVLN